MKSPLMLALPFSNESEGVSVCETVDGEVRVGEERGGRGVGSTRNNNLSLDSKKSSSVTTAGMSRSTHFPAVGGGKHTPPW